MAHLRTRRIVAATTAVTVLTAGSVALAASGDGPTEGPDPLLSAGEAPPTVVASDVDDVDASVEDADSVTSPPSVDEPDDGPGDVTADPSEVESVDSPASVDSPTSVESPPSAESPDSVESPQSVESPESVESVDSPQSADSPESVDSPPSVESPESVESPASVDSPDEDASAED